MTTTENPTRFFSDLSKSPSALFRTVGTVTLTEPHTFIEYGPNAANWTEVECEPQTVALESNGYYVRAHFAGTAIRGGLSFRSSDAGKPYRYGWQTHAYIADGLHSATLPTCLTVTRAKPGEKLMGGWRPSEWLTCGDCLRSTNHRAESLTDGRMVRECSGCGSLAKSDR